MNLRIGIDGRPLEGRRRGVGRYVLELCRQLDTLLPEAHFFLYSRERLAMPVSSQRWAARTEPFAVARRLSPLAWLKLRGGRLAAKDRLDAFWGTNLFLPPLPRGVRTVTTIYDVSFKVVPETYPKLHLWALRWFLAADLGRADRLVAVSQATSDRVEKLLGRAATAVIPPAVDSSFRPVTESRIQETLRTLGVDRPYLLTVATWEPRKNLSTLIGAFVEMKREGLLPEHTLVLAGKKSHKFSDVTRAIGSGAEEQIADLGYVPDEHLPALYSGADALVFPSTYEGFGMPVLESRACGVPVVTTDIPELREAGEKDAIYIEPTREGIRQGILKALALDKRPEPLSDPPTWRDQAKALSSLLAAARG